MIRVKLKISIFALIDSISLINQRTMTIQQLEYILAVDQFRHFAKAAEYCRVTQPTLSAMIQKLEDELGVKLFDRSMTPVCPTAIGKKVLEQARKILSEVICVKEIISEEQHSLSGTFRLAVLPTIAPYHSLSGTFRLAVLPTIAPYLLPRFFPQLMEKYPDLDIRVMEMKTPDIRKALLTGEADAAIIASMLDDAALTEETLFYEQFLGYVSKKEPLFKHDVIRTSDVTGERLWLLDEGHCFRDQLVRFCQMEAVKISQMAYRLGSMETFMHMVESGKGITFIPELAVMQLSEEQKELVRPFAIPRPTRQIVLVTRKDFIRTSLLQVLKEEIQAAVPKEMLTLQAVQCLV
jgi:LysR family transcriptional regulator, hydrogen peroxide-inducible genes activator